MFHFLLARIFTGYANLDTNFTLREMTKWNEPKNSLISRIFSLHFPRNVNSLYFQFFSVRTRNTTKRCSLVDCILVGIFEFRYVQSLQKPAIKSEILALNPVIYTVFNREFRICFKRLLTCHHLNHPVSNKVGKFFN